MKRCRTLNRGGHVSKELLDCDVAGTLTVRGETTMHKPLTVNSNLSATVVHADSVQSNVLYVTSLTSSTFEGETLSVNAIDANHASIQSLKLGTPAPGCTGYLTDAAPLASTVEAGELTPVSTLALEAGTFILSYSVRTHSEADRYAVRVTDPAVISEDCCDVQGLPYFSIANSTVYACAASTQLNLCVEIGGSGPFELDATFRACRLV